MFRKMLVAALCLATLGRGQELPVKYHAFRLRGGQDLKQEMAAYARSHEIRAGWIVCCVGSLSAWPTRLRPANMRAPGLHLHLAASDSQGRTLAIGSIPRLKLSWESVLTRLPAHWSWRCMFREKQAGNNKIHNANIGHICFIELYRPKRLFS